MHGVELSGHATCRVIRPPCQLATDRQRAEPGALGRLQHRHAHRRSTNDPDGSTNDPDEVTGYLDEIAADPEAKWRQ
jgi:hypothetical protein